MSGRASRPDTQADFSVRNCLEKKQSFLMIAGAGSGKTTSLIKALAYLRDHDGTVLKKNGQQVACITYTNVAVDEIWADVGKDALFHVSTIHSFLWEIAKPFQREIRAWVVQQIREKIAELEEKNTKSGTHSGTKEKNKRTIKQLNDALAVLDKVRSFKYETDRRYADGILGHADIIKMVPHLLVNNALLRKIVARKYPVVFVDESQDTDKTFIDALKMVDQDEGENFCLGFFGDRMQQIYALGIGPIAKKENWKEITKEENFRCSKAVLTLINQIRKDGDGLEQTDGLATLSTGGETVVGSARMFIMPVDQDRGKSIDQIRKWLASQENDPLWLEDSPEADVRVLVIVHRMAANRLGFPDIFHALHDKGPGSFKSGFMEGTLWVISPFVRTLVPIVKAVSQGNEYRVISLLREAKSSLLTHDRLIQETNPALHLSSIKIAVKELHDMISPKENPGTTIKKCLDLVSSNNLIPLDDRMVSTLSGDLTAEALSDDEDDGEGKGEGEKKLQAINAFLDCPVSQLWHYCSYLGKESPFSTQHGVKGAEFLRVLVVLDDEEGKHKQYSFDRLLGIAPLSGTDLKNKDEGKENSIDRTRRLFYVCCSRARKDLAVVLFTENIRTSRQKLVSTGIFNENDIFTADDLL